MPCHKLYEDHRVIALLDIFPTTKGHTLLVQKEHEQDVLHSSEENAQALLTTARSLAPTIMKTVHATDINVIFNVGANAGQTIFHTHMHIIPRYAGDGLETWPQGETDHEAFKKLAEEIKGNV